MDCEYTDPDDILIDWIIDGVHAKKLQESLLDRGEELTLAKAIEIGQYEMSQKQVRVVRDEEPPILALAPKNRNLRRNLTRTKGSTAPGVAKTLSTTGIRGNVPPWDPPAPTVSSLAIG